MGVTAGTGSPEASAPAALAAEAKRVYDICAGCRRCYNLCPSFTYLLDTADEQHDGDGAALTPAEDRRVVDLCFGCNLCYPHCPYTPPHRWAVDFPRLMLRARSAEARAKGVTLQDRFLGNTELVGRIGSLTAPISNWMNAVWVNRKFMEKAVGIHARRNLPPFHRETFSRWFDGRKPRPRSAPARDRVALFTTCSVEYNDPATGKAAVVVLEKNGVDVALPAQRCCGMPYLDGGAVDQARALIRDNVRSLAAAVREGRTIVVPGPTCSYMLKQEYPWLDGGDDAKLVARNTRDLFEYLAALHAEGKLDTRFTQPVGAVTYHVPCHLRAQNIGHKSADVLRLIPGATVDVVEKCSAVDGTWGFKTQYHELSLKLAKPLFDAITRADAPVTATDCPLAALQIEQGTGRQAKHPIRVLAAAYGLEE